ncbi:MAG: glycosyltransferase family 2 protein, partial [Oscillospiraceae bacterium]|nr:glycosyltransferase family 2 protein [Oscillospiraceae bacterium]
MVELENNIKTLKVCLVIPTYNHAAFLEEVVKECLKYPIDIIVVNDGSTDDTLLILDNYKSRITVVSYENNRGKGYALKQGAKKAREQGNNAIITMDSDGQHFALDIKTLVNAALNNRDAIIVGSRGLQNKNMPKKNSFANRFANFW